MPIQWHKQPDGTWLLWNTEESDAQPMQIDPATVGAAGAAGTDVGAQADEQGNRPDPELSQYGFKLKPTADDRKFVHGAIKDLQKGDLTEEERHKLAMSMLEQHLYSVTDSGDVYGAFRHNPGGKKGTQAILDLLGGFKETADNELGALGVDTGQLTTQEIINLFRSRGELQNVPDIQSTPESDQPTTTTQQWRSKVEGQIGQAKGMTGQFQLGAWHQMGGEEE